MKFHTSHTPCLITPHLGLTFHWQITMMSSNSISKRMKQLHIIGTVSNYRTPVKLGTRWQNDQVSVPLLGQELRRHELLKCKDTFDAKYWAKENLGEDIENAPITSSSGGDNCKDVVEIDDIPTKHIYIWSPPPYKQQYSRHVLSQGLQVPNLREDAMHKYNEWKELMPSLMKPMLNFLPKPSCKPSNTNITMQPCNKCDGGKTLCLFGDCLLCILYIWLSNI